MMCLRGCTSVIWHSFRCIQAGRQAASQPAIATFYRYPDSRLGRDIDKDVQQCG